MSNVFNGKKLMKSMCQTPNLERLLRKSKLMPVEKKFCGENCVCSPYISKVSSFSKK